MCNHSLFIFFIPSSSIVYILFYSVYVLKLFLEMLIDPYKLSTHAFPNAGELGTPALFTNHLFVCAVIDKQSEQFS